MKNNLKQLLDEKELSQRMLKEVMDDMEFPYEEASYPAVNKWYKNASNPTLYNAIKICIALEIALDDLFLVESDEDKEQIEKWQDTANLIFEYAKNA